jgi:4'-phosphopantetheinyl transferase
MHTILYWLTQNLSDVPADSDWLTEGERVVEEGLRFSKRRNDWRLGRWTAKHAVCSYLGKPISFFPFLEILAAEDGAPEVYVNHGPAGVSISISHCRERGLCVTGAPGTTVGCDIERIEARSDSFISDYFTSGEKALCERSSGEDKILIINLIWSAKESVLKILREGLRRDTRSVDIQVYEGKTGGGWNPWKGLCIETSCFFLGWWKAEDGLIYTLASNHSSRLPEQMVLKNHET